MTAFHPKRTGGFRPIADTGGVPVCSCGLVGRAGRRVVVCFAQSKELEVSDYGDRLKALKLRRENDPRTFEQIMQSIGLLMNRRELDRPDEALEREIAAEYDLLTVPVP